MEIWNPAVELGKHRWPCAERRPSLTKDRQPELASWQSYGKIGETSFRFLVGEINFLRHVISSTRHFLETSLRSVSVIEPRLDDPTKRRVLGTVAAVRRSLVENADSLRIVLRRRYNSSG
jgi:hypothetical protein